MTLSTSSQHSQLIRQFPYFYQSSSIRLLATLIRSVINSQFVTLLKTYNRQFQIDLTKIKQSPQEGHTCKITALASLDYYHSCFNKVAHIPLRKRDLPGSNPAISFRQISKKHHSLQGEVLEDKRLINIAEEAGYTTSVKQPKNVNDFIRVVTSNIYKGYPVLSCFSVNIGQDSKVDSDLPTDVYHNSEHACLITSINRKNRTIDIVHWQKAYRNISIDLFYKSMNALPETRSPETYVKLNGKQDHKYELMGFPAVDLTRVSYDSNSERTTHTPEINTGFKNKLFIMKPDLSHERWHKNNSIR